MAQSESRCRQNFHKECEAAINKQINLELYASYVYQAMAYHFDRDDVALRGFHNFFKKSSDEEREHAEKFMKLQNQRGGRIVLQDISKPSKQDWGANGGVESLSDALELEKTVNQALLDLHKLAGDKGDAHLCDFLESEFLTEQVEAIKELSDHITNVNRVGPGLGLYQFDKLTLSS
eukprot:TRINITY_DN57180_c0_g1_i1.p1 TRINITY_DN57180_c0_g1~~TRINITY_DN57180_c0_g1_i1.p1  ORF type:complete len:177 (-),score=35.15 TRINITY_DN57180_c0_g1_i1:46-576(-)